MIKKLLYKAAWLGATILFLLIAWATSEDEPIELRTVAVTARAEGQAILLKSETTEALSDLNLVLNGIFTKEGVSLAPGAEISIPFSDFKDRNQNAYPPTEEPYSLEVFQNGDGTTGSGGYTKIQFD